MREFDEVDTLAARVLLLSPLARLGRPTPEELQETEQTAPRCAEPFEGGSDRPEWAAQRLRNALEAAVDRALDGVRRVAVLTGGGTDSSALLALAVSWARRTGGTAFGVALDFGGQGDDRPYLRVLERELACQIVRCKPEDAAHRFDLTMDGVDGAPFTWPGAPMEVEMLARAKSLGADVALMGVGADELLDGDPRSLAGFVRDGRIWAAWRSVARLEGFDRPRFPAISWLARPLLASVVPTAVRRRRARHRRPSIAHWAGPALHAFHDAWCAMQLERSLVDLTHASARREAFRTAPHHEHLRSLRRQETAASGLPRRDPFLDTAFAHVVLDLPPAWLLQGGVRRGLFREAMRGVLPEAIRERRDKASFEPAFTRFFAATDGRRRFALVSDGRALEERDLVVGTRFRADVRAFLDAPNDDGWGTVWPALAVESFLRARLRQREGALS